MLLRRLVGYLAGLTRPRVVLWCYFIWWLVVAARYFDPTPRLWLTSLGLAGIVGVALLLNAGWGSGRTPDRWQTLRFFIMPFCVSSFAALVKGRGFFLVFSPQLAEVTLGAGACLGFILLAAVSRRFFSCDTTTVAAS